VDEITFKMATDAKNPATASAILGPFFRHNAPILENESSIVHEVDDGEITYMYGIVSDLETNKPIADAWMTVRLSIIYEPNSRLMSMVAMPSIA
jgi:catechol 1,2-dioxygenase